MHFLSSCPPPQTLPFSHKSIQAGVSRMTAERRTGGSRRGSSPKPRDLCYLHPVVPRPGSSLSLSARAL